MIKNKALIPALILISFLAISISTFLTYIALSNNLGDVYCVPIEAESANYETWGVPCRIRTARVSEHFIFASVAVFIALTLILSTLMLLGALVGRALKLLKN
jgi:hypothetical protein